MTRAVTTVRIINNKSSVPPLSLNLTQTAPIYRVALTSGQLALVGSGGAGGYTYSATGLPAGLSLNTATGSITGTPTTIGHNIITATVTDSATNTFTTTFTIDVLTRLIGTAIAPTPMERSLTYSYTFVLTGNTGAVTWAVTSGALPAGITLSSGGVLAGTPTTAGNYSFSVTATDSVTGDSFVVACSLTCIDYLTPVGGSVPSGPINVPVSTRLTNISTTGIFYDPSVYTINWSVSATPSTGVLISLVPIAGSYDTTLVVTPLVAGSYSFSLTATDSFGVTVTNPISIANYFTPNQKITTQQSGVDVGAANIAKINFVGAAVADSGSGVRTVTIPTVAGPAGANGHGSTTTTAAPTLVSGNWRFTVADTTAFNAFGLPIYCGDSTNSIRGTVYNVLSSTQIDITPVSSIGTVSSITNGSTFTFSGVAGATGPSGAGGGGSSYIYFA